AHGPDDDGVGYASYAPFGAACFVAEGVMSIFDKAISDIAAERERQINVEGYTPEHDDQHATGEIAAMAAFYAMPQGLRGWGLGCGVTLGRTIRPEGWTPKTCERREELVKAGALIVAEIERLDRGVSR
ncbi:MAG: hypothetical protein ACREBN_10545, partial [Burkholderiaceae bacterium]